MFYFSIMQREPPPAARTPSLSWQSSPHRPERGVKIMPHHLLHKAQIGRHRHAHCDRSKWALSLCQCVRESEKERHNLENWNPLKGLNRKIGWVRVGEIMRGQDGKLERGCCWGDMEFLYSSDESVGATDISNLVSVTQRGQSKCFHRLHFAALTLNDYKWLGSCSCRHICYCVPVLFF